MFAGAARFATLRSPSPSSMLDLEFAELSDVGRVRDHNEDYSGRSLPSSEVAGRTQGWLFAVADGVGGEELGEVASQTAIETLIAGFRAAPKGEAHTVLMPRLIQTANTRIYELGKAASAGGSRMATTVVACALRYDRVVVAHVGDSRCYLIRHGLASQITRDHTVVAEQVRLGLLSEREAAEAETRHLLSRSLGNDLFVNVEIGDRQLHVDDVLLLCSDGLHGPVGGQEIAEIVRWNPDLNTAAAKLIALANDRDGGDNVSVQLIRIRDVERMGMYRGRPYKLR
jgi:serine/threonine protein phosphatase PrpC